MWTKIFRFEAATFIWMQEHCPETPIPQLYGFGLVGGQTVCGPNFSLLLPTPNLM